MCGIAGFSGAFETTLLDRMSAVISHRGPDGHGVFHDQSAGVGLAHRRLAILDLSSAGHQPMEDEAARAVIVFNGEIYNFRELKADLVARGCRFRSNTDTEVLLQLYLHHGKDMLRLLNGMFAFAIWDKAKRHLFLARDGLGVKPLYYAETSRGLIFSSEIKALLQEASLPRVIDPAAVASHLTLLWCPAPRTILKDVAKLEPGMAMIVADGHIQQQWRHYELPFGRSKRQLPVQVAITEFRTILDRAVERQMVADVPVGAFLSGGLDSSAVAAYALKYTRERLQCFTIDYNDANSADEMIADLPYAQRVARHLDVDLHIVKVGPDMIDHLSDMIFYLDEPQADPAPLNALFISKLARDSGIKVLLSGAGGDDILTGYRRHVALRYERYWAWLPKTGRAAIAGVAGQLGSHSAPLRRVRKALEYAALEANERIASYFYWLNPQEAVGLLNPDLRAALAGVTIAGELQSAAASVPAEGTRLDRMLHLDSRFFLADHNLNYTDRMSMAHGVEVRVPLLDPDLVDFAASLPDDMRQRNTVSKWIFKKAMQGVLPDDVIYRPKTGFGVPLRAWLSGPLKPMLEEMLSPAALNRHGIFDPAAVARLVQLDRTGRIDAAYTLLAVLCIQLWCKIFLTENIFQPGLKAEA